MRKVFLYKFHWDCGRMGDLEGLFFASPEEVEELEGKEVYFGEVLGKHSEVFGIIEPGEISIVQNITEETRKELFSAFGETVSGYNPVEKYMERKE